MTSSHRLFKSRPWCVSSVVVAIALVASHVAHVATQTIEYRRGQNIQPAFDGYEENPDGTLTLWFGYLNRNYDEVIDVPAGPANSLTPGPADRGQPTHFLARRHKSMFSVVVPKNFGTLTWTVTVRGETASAIANNNLHNIIDRKHSTLRGPIGKANEPDNTPPVVTVQPPTLELSKDGRGKIAISATDDGLPAFNGKAVGLSFAATVFRGAGRATFTPPGGKLDPQGKGSVEVSFAEPGDYQIQIRVDDGSSNSGTFCCWTDALVKVKVQ